MGKKSSGDVRQLMAGHAFAWLALLADCLHIGHTERVRGKGLVVPEEGPLHIMCVWKDRNLSLTSHRQLSTYSFEVYLVVLLLPLPLLDCVWRWWWFWGIRVWSFIPTDWEIEWSVRRWVRQFVNFASFCLLSSSSSCWADAVDTAAQYNVTVQLMSSPGQNVNRIQ